MEEKMKLSIGNVTSRFLAESYRYHFYRQAQVMTKQADNGEYSISTKLMSVINPEKSARAGSDSAEIDLLLGDVSFPMPLSNASCSMLNQSNQLNA